MKKNEYIRRAVSVSSCKYYYVGSMRKFPKFRASSAKCIGVSGVRVVVKRWRFERFNCLLRRDIIDCRYRSRVTGKTDVLSWPWFPSIRSLFIQWKVKISFPPDFFEVFAAFHSTRARNIRSVIFGRVPTVVA